MLLQVHSVNSFAIPAVAICEESLKEDKDLYEVNHLLVKSESNLSRFSPLWAECIQRLGTSYLCFSRNSIEQIV